MMFGAPAGALGGWSHAGVDSAVVRPISPVKASYPRAYSGTGIRPGNPPRRAATRVRRTVRATGAGRGQGSAEFPVRAASARQGQIFDRLAVDGAGGDDDQTVAVEQPGQMCGADMAVGDPAARLGRPRGQDA